MKKTNKITLFFSAISKFLPIVILSLVSLTFFWKFFLKGLIPIPADITVGMYYPWLDYKWGYVVGVPVKNHLLTDSVSQFWIWRNLAIDFFRSGQSPFWNPYALAGSPLVPVFHSSFFSPFNLLYFLFNKTQAMSLIVVAQPFFACLFTFWLLRKWQFHFLTAILGSLIFGFSGFMLSWLEWGNIGHTLMWLPLLVLVTEKYAEKGSRVWLFFLILSLGISLSGGHPQTFFYVFLTWFGYFIWRLYEREKWRAIFSAITISAVFAVLFSFLIFPAAESYWYSIRSTENYISQNNFGFFPPIHTITFLAPDFFGNPSTGNWWGKGFNYQELVGYFGLIPLFLAVAGLIKGGRQLRFWKVIFLLTMALSFRYPFGWLIYFLKIPLLSTASASRILMITSFAGAILAAGGLQAIRKIKISFKFAYFFWILFLSYGLAVAISLFLVRREMGFPQNEAETKVLTQFAGEISVGMRNLILPFFLLSGGHFFSFIITKTKKNSFLTNLFTLAILVLTAAELFRFGWKYNSFVKPNLYFPKVPIIEELQKKITGYERIERERGEVLPPNMWIPYGLYSASGYDPVYPLAYSQFLAKLGDGKFHAGGVGRYGEIENYRSPLFDYLGIKYILALKKDEQSRISVAGKPNYKFGLEKFKVSSESGSVSLLENKDVFPRAFLVPELESSSLEEIFGETKILLYQSGRVNVQINSPRKGFLVLTDTDFPGWKAFIDGKEEKVQKANLVFKGVLVPAGEHLVSFVYNPISFSLGVKISLVSFFLISLVFWFKKIAPFQRR